MLLEGNNNRHFVHLSDNWLVWLENDTKIKAMDLSQSNPQPILLHSNSLKGIPRIDGDLVIWYSDSNSNNRDVYGFDLGNIGAGAFPIAATAKDEFAGAVSGNIVLFKHIEAHNVIRGLDISDPSASEFSFEADGLVSHSGVSIDGNTIVYSENLTRNSGDLYVNFIVPEPSVLGIWGIGALMLDLRRRMPTPCKNM
jgi:hypothetical protein